MKNDLGIKKINVDKSNYKAIASIKKGDDVKVILELYKNNSSFNVSGQTITITALREDGVKIEQKNAFSVSGNKITVDFLNTMFECVGITEIDINFKDSTGNMTSLSFYMKIYDKANRIININTGNTGGSNNSSGNIDISGLQNRLSTLEGQVNYILNNMPSGGDSNNDVVLRELTTKVNTLNNTVSTLNGKVSTLEGELSNLKNRVSILENKNNVTIPPSNNPPSTKPPTEATPTPTPPSTGTNILPKFTSSDWTYISGATDVIKNEYTTSFTTPTAWEGVSIWNWQGVNAGDVIIVGVSGSGSDTQIQLWANEEEILKFTSGTGAREKTITIPESATGYDLSIVTGTAKGTVSVSGLYVYKKSSSTSPAPTPPSTGTNLLPEFTSSDWTYIDGATSVVKNGHSTSFVTPKAWEGVSIWNWKGVKAGETITVGVKETNNNTQIQLWANEEEILELESGTEAREKTITLPEAPITGYDFSIVSTTERTTVSVKDVYVYNGKGSSSSKPEEQPPTTPPPDTSPPIAMSTVNILPRFDSSSWTYIEGATNVVKNEYTTSFTTPTAWEGVSIWNWQGIKEGNIIKVGVKGSSENVRVQLWVNQVDVLGLENGTGAREKVIVVPPSNTGYDFSIVSSTENSTVSIKDIYVYKADLTVGVDPYPLLGKNVGYRRVKESSSLSSNHVIVYNASTFKNAVANAKPGQTIYVRNGSYSLGTLNITKSGASSEYITIKNYPGERPNIVGSQVTFANNVKYVNFEGFLLRDLQGSWISCLKVGAGCSYINIRNNEITNIKQLKSNSENNGCNPLVLYGDGSTPISNCIIENNYIHHCDTGWSEALTLNGNVTNCQVIQNTIDDCKNIGIDLAGNFSWTGSVGDSNNQARFITVARNLVMNCQSPYATSAGLYCDGGRNNTFEYNITYNCQCGIEVGAEEAGATVENFYIRNNLIINCGRSIGVGGYQSTSATHRNTYIYNNTIIGKDGQAENCGLMLERTNNVEFCNNIVIGQSEFEFYENYNNLGKNVIRKNNLYYKPDGSLPSGEDNSIFADPKLSKLTYDLSGDFKLTELSEAIDKGITSDKYGDIDILGNTRVKNSKVDIGAYEY